MARYPLTTDADPVNINHHSPDVTRQNQIHYLYLKGNETDIGSMRIQVDPITGAKFHFEIVNEFGVWEDASLLAAVSSLGLGRDLQIESAGGWIQTLSASDAAEAKRLIPHVHYNAGGSFGLHSPTVAEQRIEDDWQFRQDAENIPSTDQIMTFEMDDNIFSTKFYFRMGGSIPQNGDVVTFTIHNGSDTNAPITFLKRYHGSQFIANPDWETEAIVNTPLDLNGIATMNYDVHRLNNDVTFRLQCDGAPISLLVETAPYREYEANAWWFAMDYQSFLGEAIVQENLVLDLNLDPIVVRSDNINNPIQYVTTNPFLRPLS